MNQEYWQLRAASRNYQDAHRLVTKLTNRLSALARDGRTDLVLQEQVDAAKRGRDESAKILRKIYVTEAPAAIRKFQENTAGLGDTLMAQLIGEVGDFRTYVEAWWAEDPTGEEKRVLETGGEVSVGVREIWGFYGHGDATRKRKRGGTQEEMFAAGNPTAKTIIHLMTDFAVRLNGIPDKNGRARAECPYYWKYKEAKAHIKAAHPDWTPGHCDNHAKRVVAKAILKDLWRVQHGQDPVYGAVTPWTPRPVMEARV